MQKIGIVSFSKEKKFLFPVFPPLSFLLSFYHDLSLLLSLCGCCRVDWRFCHACFDRLGRAQVPTVWQLSSNPAAYCCTNALALAHIHTHPYMACMSIRQRWGDSLSVYSISFSFALFTSLPLSLASCVLEGRKV